MSEILLAATPLDGHVLPVVGVGCALRDRGHRVRMLTGAAFRGLVQAHGLGFRELSGAARPPTGAERPPRDSARRPQLPWSRGVDDVIEHFIDPIGAQHEALAAALAGSRVDAIVCDTGFLGAIPLLLGSRRSDRPPILGLSVTPISLPSVDAAPFGSALQPGPGRRYVRRNRRIRALLDRGPLRPLHRAIDDALRGYGVAPGSFDYFAQVAAFDATVHLGLPELEYPRRELPDRVRLVGPLRPLAEPDQALPTWWPELAAAGSRPIVHVTQGTLENRDGRRLLVPAIRALADSEVLVVVSTGRRPLHELSAQLGSPIPANVRMAEYLPYGRLLEHVDVLVSNGGYGSVQLAVRHGIPVVVAGGTTDKPETAARVAWSGAGLDLHTGRPSERALRRAVQRVLEDPRYRSRAATIQAAADARSDPAAAVVAAVETLTQRATTPLTDPGE